jgi:acetylornithine deacetylase/succinyl-diaminopimelate desuccinylase-like protein
MRDLYLPTVICALGDISVAHRSDEFVSKAELCACARFIDQQIDVLTVGRLG